MDYGMTLCFYYIDDGKLSITLSTFFKANAGWSNGPVNITSGITPDLLDIYAHVAAEAIEGTRGDPRGVQQIRLDMIRQAISQLSK